MIFWRKPVVKLLFCAFVFLISDKLAYPGSAASDNQAWNDLAYKLVEMSIDLKDRESIEAHRKEIERLLELESDSAFYWYLHARLIKAHLSAYYLENKDLKFKERGDYYSDQYVIAQREIMYTSYEKALNSNKSSGPDEKLNYRMLDSIAADLGAPYQTRAQALRQLLAVPESEVPRYSDGDAHGNRVLGIYQDIVTAHLDGMDFDGALSVLDEMREEFPYLQVEIEQATSDVLARKQLYETEANVQQEDEKAIGKSKAGDIASSDLQKDSAGIETNLSPRKNTGYLFYIFILPPLAIGLLALMRVFQRRRKK